jgi:hypothetical protein
MKGRLLEDIGGSGHGLRYGSPQYVRAGPEDTVRNITVAAFRTYIRMRNLPNRKLHLWSWNHDLNKVRSNRMTPRFDWTKLIFSVNGKWRSPEHILTHCSLKNRGKEWRESGEGGKVTLHCTGEREEFQAWKAVSILLSGRSKLEKGYSVGKWTMQSISKCTL